MKHITYLFFTVFLTACAVVDVDERLPMQLPADYNRSVTEEKQELSETDWWKKFSNSDLSRIITVALSKNPSYLQSVQRLEQASSFLNQKKSSKLPSFIVSTNASTQEDTKSNNQIDKFDLSAVLQYEIDLWGAYQHDIDSGSLQKQLAVDALQLAQNHLVASIINIWFRLSALHEELLILNKQIEDQRRIHEILQFSYQNGAVTSNTVLQQEGSQLRLQSELLEIQSNIEQSNNNLSLLLGSSPATNIFSFNGDIISIPPLPNTGIPSDLLHKRADVRSAWTNVKIAEKKQMVSSAQTFPSFTLSTSGASSSSKFVDLFDSWLLRLALRTSTIIFDGGRRESQMKQLSSVTEERYQSYRETVLKAIADVETALSNNHYLMQKKDMMLGQLRLSRSALSNAEYGYQHGRGSYLDVLRARSNVFALERQSLNLHYALLNARIAVHQALGFTSLTIDTTEIIKNE